MLRRLHFALVLVPALIASVAGQRAPLCRDWQDCRRLALEAKEQGAYDRFHDLAWAAVQAGPKNDPGLMYLVAHAQALSGRPHNALVMLQRLADAGVATDADTDPDFEQPRLLPEWPEAAAKIARVLAAPRMSLSSAAVTAPAAARADAPPVAGAPRPALAAPVPAITPRPPAAASATASAAPAPAIPRESVPVTPTDAGSFSTFAPAPFVSAGLAYDVVSHRFVVGDTAARRLLVVATGATHSDDLVRIEPALGDVTAIGIDERRGVLWVAGASSTAGEGGLQRLQLVSGRALKSYRPQASAGPTRLVDLAVLDSGDVIALDAAGNRLLSLTGAATELTVGAPLKLSGVTSLARRTDGLVYVAHESGIARVDLRTGAVVQLSAPKGMDLGRLETIRTYRNVLIGLQTAADGSRTLVRLDLNAGGGAVTTVAVLDTPSFRTDRRLSLAVSGDDLYYLANDSPDRQPGTASNSSTPGTQLVIRRIALR